MKPKVLFFDIETRPNLAYVWGKYKQNVLSFKEDWSMLSFAYKWQGEREVKCVTAQGDKTDRKVIKALHALLDKADIVIGHNGDEFDNKKFRARCLVYGIKPPAPYRTVDTLKVAKGRFNFVSNSLNDLGQVLGIGRKLSTGGFDLWLDCMAGKKSAWAKMIKYNKQDVVLLEKVYDRMLPWIDTHPNVAQILDRPSGCPKCGNTSFQARGVRYTKTSSFRRWQCQSCHGYCSSRVAEKTTKPEKV